MTQTAHPFSRSARSSALPAQWKHIEPSGAVPVSAAPFSRNLSIDKMNSFVDRPREHFKTPQNKKAARLIRFCSNY
jgi:hypothetical protein